MLDTALLALLTAEVAVLLLMVYHVDRPQITDASQLTFGRPFPDQPAGDGIWSVVLNNDGNRIARLSRISFTVHVAGMAAPAVRRAPFREAIAALGEAGLRDSEHYEWTAITPGFALPPNATFPWLTMPAPVARRMLRLTAHTTWRPAGLGRGRRRDIELVPPPDDPHRRSALPAARPRSGESR